MFKTHFIPLVFLILYSSSVSSQDYGGEWKGHSTFGKTQYDFTMTAYQDGKVLTGTASVNGSKDSAKYYFNGTIEKGQAKLSATAFIHKSGLHCLPKFKLALSGNKLEGTYGSNIIWGGCLPGVKGDVVLTRVSNQQKLAEPPPIKIKPLLVEDFEGSELIKALKTRKYYALVIAINDYSDPDIPSLSKPITDASILINTLQSHYTFEKEDISFLQNPSRSMLIEAFDKLSQEITNRDNLLIFYAGHGIWDAKLKQGFWLPSDASMSSKAQWLSNGTIRDFVRAIDSKHTLLITDACFGGSILKERAVFYNGKAMLEMYKRPSRKAMTSGAFSTVPDESVFIKYLIKNLTNNQSPLISAEQVYGDFKVAVINNSETGQVPQYGAISLAGDEGGDFIFLKRNLSE
ncbi:caspase family protein [Fulvivirga sp. RKSG066]|uniref:caspase family protein n=1 Tax=Fulvivirga aurantia TaxID=2529383 RepID=UPI0012BC4B6A|nr:caspase family protein [Fulvivirga aurantia]MTI20388.1 caspase family protein [Fulvivirga aurantia]